MATCCGGDESLHRTYPNPIGLCCSPSSSLPLAALNKIWIRWRQALRFSVSHGCRGFSDSQSCWPLMGHHRLTSSSVWVETASKKTNLRQEASHFRACAVYPSWYLSSNYWHYLLRLSCASVRCLERWGFVGRSLPGTSYVPGLACFQSLDWTCEEPSCGWSHKCSNHRTIRQ